MIHKRGVAQALFSYTTLFLFVYRDLVGMVGGFCVIADVAEIVGVAMQKWAWPQNFRALVPHPFLIRLATMYTSYCTRNQSNIKRSVLPNGTIILAWKEPERSTLLILMDYW